MVKVDYLHIFFFSLKKNNSDAKLTTVINNNIPNNSRIYKS